MIVVERAVPISRQLREGKYQLPPGYPFLVDDDTGEVLEFPALYMSARLPPDLWVPKTTVVAAYEICRFANYCADAGKSFADVDSDFLAEYRDIRLNTVSLQTHNFRDGKGEARGFYRIYDMFRWAVNRGDLESNPFDIFLEDEQDDAVSSSGERFKRSPIAAFYRPLGHEQQVRAMPVAHWSSIRAELSGALSKGSSRPRVSCELSITSGARVEECSRVDVYQIENLEVPDSMDDAAIVRMRLLWTKGGRERVIELTAALVRDLKAYIRGERARCIEASQKYKTSPDEADTLALFVNREDAGRFVGKRTSADILADDFRKAVLACGLTEKVKKSDPLSGQEYFTLVAKYSFHCLRHTFAVWFYLGNVNSGNLSPWKELQSLLGHRYLSTTMNIYLSAVDTTRAVVNAKVFSAVRSKYSGN